MRKIRALALSFKLQIESSFRSKICRLARILLPRAKDFLPQRCGLGFKMSSNKVRARKLLKNKVGPFLELILKVTLNVLPQPNLTRLTCSTLLITLRSQLFTQGYVLKVAIKNRLNMNMSLTKLLVSSKLRKRQLPLSWRRNYSQ